MNNDRETEKILFDISRAGKVVKTMMLIGNPAAMILFTFLKRMVKQKLLKVGEFDKISAFINATKGQYDIMNVPMAQSGAIGSYWNKKKMTDDLEAMGVSFNVLPDLNNEDGIIQVAVAQKDRDKFSAWFSRHIVNQMKGGEKTVQDLQNLTDGRISIVSIPFEQKEHLLKDDFEKLGINYASLPDLNVGDGDIQIYVANADMQKVEHWFGLYRDERVAAGEEAPQMQVMSAAQYTGSGQISEEDYIATADEKVKAANAIYEGQGVVELEQAVMKPQTEIKTMDDVAFAKFDNDPDYIKISINEKTLVEESMVAEKMNQDNQTIFASRVPRTWRQGTKRCSPEETLILPKGNVFRQLDIDKESGENVYTYIGFLPRNEKPTVLNIDGSPEQEKYQNGEDLYNASYAEVDRKFKEKEHLIKADNKVENISYEKRSGNLGPVSKQRSTPKGVANFAPREYDYDQLENALIKAQDVAKDGKQIIDKAPVNPIKTVSK